MAIRIVLVDDHDVVREGLRAALAQQEEFAFVGEARDARSAYAVIARALPDVVLLDLCLPGVGGPTAVREVTLRAPTARVVVLSMLDGEEIVARALYAGAHGYVIKAQPIAELAGAIREVAAGGQYVTPHVSSNLVGGMLRGMRRRTDDGPLGALSEREREVFDLLVRGFGNGAIAGQLCISAKTVATHRSRVFHKLRVHSIADLVRFAAREALPLG